MSRRGLPCYDGAIIRLPSFANQATLSLALQLAAQRTLRDWQVLPRLPRSCPRDGWLPRTFRARLRLGLLGLAKLLLLAHVLFFGSVSMVLFVWKISDPAATGLMLYRRVANGTEIKPVRFIPFKQIPLSSRNAFIHLEDHEFWTHWGISPPAIKEAMRLNKKFGRTVYGASTITQQTARTLLLWPERTWLRKYLEAGTALLMEAILGKQRIMELYLNYIEFGPGIFGLGSAARYHYGTAFANLGWEQRMRLTVIITSPLRYNVKTFWNNRGMVARYYALVGESPQQ